MKLHVVVNPKAKAALIAWMKNKRPQAEQSGPQSIENINALSAIMGEVRDDFVLDRDLGYSVIVFEKNLFLVEMPRHPIEIFEYLEINPDGLKNHAMNLVIPVLRVFLDEMLDHAEKKYE